MERGFVYRTLALRGNPQAVRLNGEAHGHVVEGLGARIVPAAVQLIGNNGYGVVLHDGSDGIVVRDRNHVDIVYARVQIVDRSLDHRTVVDGVAEDRPARGNAGRFGNVALHHIFIGGEAAGCDDNRARVDCIFRAVAAYGTHAGYFGAGFIGEIARTLGFQHVPAAQRGIVGDQLIKVGTDGFDTIAERAGVFVAFFLLAIENEIHADAEFGFLFLARLAEPEAVVVDKPVDGVAGVVDEKVDHFGLGVSVSVGVPILAERFGVDIVFAAVIFSLIFGGVYAHGGAGQR